MSLEESSKPSLVSVVIPTFSRIDSLERCLESVSKSDYPHVETIVVDDSPDGRIASVMGPRFPQIKIVRTKGNELVSKARNIGASFSSGNYVLFLDDDNVLAPNAISSLTRVLSKDDTIGVACPLMFYLESPDVVWCAGIRRNSFATVSVPIASGRNRSNFPHEIASDDMPNALMIRREVLYKCGLFDCRSFPMHYEEADLCGRIRRQGYRVVVVTSAKLWHDLPRRQRISATVTALTRANAGMRLYFNARNRIIFQKKHHGLAKHFIFLYMYLPWLLQLECVKALATPPSRVANLKAVFRGLIDGLQYSSRSCFKDVRVLTKAWLRPQEK
jgi:GT2 family glycosyltransferase